MMNEDILISIVTINKNNKNGLKKTIDSVKRQKFLNKEFIIIDGNSEDGSNTIINQNKRFISKYLSEQDNGISDAFNKGIKVSKGKWIIFLNSGDSFIDSDTLNRASEFLRDKDADLVVGSVHIFKDDVFFGKYGGENLNLNNLKYFNNIPHQSTFTNRNYFNTSGLFDENYKIAMDYEILLRNFKNQNIILIEQSIAEVEYYGVTRKNEFKTYKYYRNAQIKNKVQNKFLININFLYMITKVMIKRVLGLK